MQAEPDWCLNLYLQFYIPPVLKGFNHDIHKVEATIKQRSPEESDTCRPVVWHFEIRMQFLQGVIGKHQEIQGPGKSPRNWRKKTKKNTVAMYGR
jgi:hypothetical protein